MESMEELKENITEEEIAANFRKYQESTQSSSLSDEKKQGYARSIAEINEYMAKKRHDFNQQEAEAWEAASKLHLTF